MAEVVNVTAVDKFKEALNRNGLTGGNEGLITAGTLGTLICQNYSANPPDEKVKTLVDRIAKRIEAIWQRCGKELTKVPKQKTQRTIPLREITDEDISSLLRNLIDKDQLEPRSALSSNGAEDNQELLSSTVGTDQRFLGLAVPGCLKVESTFEEIDLCQSSPTTSVYTFGKTSDNSWETMDTNKEVSDASSSSSSSQEPNIEPTAAIKSESITVGSACQSSEGDWSVNERYHFFHCLVEFVDKFKESCKQLPHIDFRNNGWFLLLEHLSDWMHEQWTLEDRDRIRSRIRKLAAGELVAFPKETITKYLRGQSLKDVEGYHEGVTFRFPIDNSFHLLFPSDSKDTHRFLAIWKDYTLKEYHGADVMPVSTLVAGAMYVSVAENIEIHRRNVSFPIPGLYPDILHPLKVYRDIADPPFLDSPTTLFILSSREVETCDQLPASEEPLLYLRSESGSTILLQYPRWESLKLHGEVNATQIERVNQNLCFPWFDAETRSLSSCFQCRLSAPITIGFYFILAAGSDNERLHWTWVRKWASKANTFVGYTTILGLWWVVCGHIGPATATSLWGRPYSVPMPVDEIIDCISRFKRTAAEMNEFWELGFAKEVFSFTSGQEGTDYHRPSKRQRCNPEEERPVTSKTEPSVFIKFFENVRIGKNHRK